MASDDLPFMSEMVKNTCGSLTTIFDKVLTHMYSTVYHNEASKKTGPINTVRFVFAIDELYSESIKEREDEKVKLQKAAPIGGNKSGSNVKKNE